MAKWIRRWMHDQALYEDVIPAALQALPKTIPRVLGFALGQAHV